MKVGDLVEWKVNYVIGRKGMSVGDLVSQKVWGLGVIVSILENNILEANVKVQLMDGSKSTKGCLYFQRHELEVIK